MPRQPKQPKVKKSELSVEQQKQERRKNRKLKKYIPALEGIEDVTVKQLRKELKDEYKAKALNTELDKIDLFFLRRRMQKREAAKRKASEPVKESSGEDQVQGGCAPCKKRVKKAAKVVAATAGACIATAAVAKECVEATEKVIEALEQ